MSDPPPAPEPQARSSVPVKVLRTIGQLSAERWEHGETVVRDLGGMFYLFGDTLTWCMRCLVKPGVKLRHRAVVEQMVRVGVDSIPIVVLVQLFIGCILALQLAPVLASYGQLDQVAVVVGIAVTRELGPLLTAIVLSGFAGASIAAELGAMVESEEVKALHAHALNPIHFLVVPRFLATAIMIIGLAVIADVVGILGGFLTSWLVLDIPSQSYIDMTREAVVFKDLLTGLAKAAVFGMLISMIACYRGLTVSGGAVGVGKATTVTVVQSIVAIIGMDAVFTSIFYVFEL